VGIVAAEDTVEDTVAVAKDTVHISLE